MAHKAINVKFCLCLLNVNTPVAQYTLKENWFSVVSQNSHDNYFSSFSSDRLVPGLDTIVPFESTKAYDMLDIIQAVCIALTLTPVCVDPLNATDCAVLAFCMLDCGRKGIF